MSFNTSLKSINETRNELGMDELTVLPNLDTHCDSCGESFTKKDIDGGRCMSCGHMIVAIFKSECKVTNEYHRGVGAGSCGKRPVFRRKDSLCD